MALRLALCALGLVFVLAGGTSALGSRAAAPCTIVAHGASTWKAEFDLTCSKAIASVDVAVNRSGCETGCNPSASVTGGTGHFRCDGISQRRGKQPWDDVNCEGSATAGATLRVFAVLRTFTQPCDIPAFKGTWKVAFGDGTHLASRSLPAYRCIVTKHARVFDNTHVGGSEPGGGYGFVLELRSVDAYRHCILGAPVWNQARHGSAWTTIVRARMSTSVTSIRPNNSITLFGNLPAGYGIGSSGTYRVVAPKLAFGNQTCPAVTVLSGGLAK